VTVVYGPNFKAQDRNAALAVVLVGGDAASRIIECPSDTEFNISTRGQSNNSYVHTVARFGEPNFRLTRPLRSMNSGRLFRSGKVVQGEDFDGSHAAKAAVNKRSPSVPFSMVIMPR
jgi:hypothetical protein